MLRKRVGARVVERQDQRTGLAISDSASALGLELGGEARPRFTRASRERGKLCGFVLQFRAGRDHSGGGPCGASSGKSAIVEFDLRARLRQPPADRHSSDPGADDDHLHGRAAVRSLAIAETMEMPQERKQSEP